MIPIRLWLPLPRAWSVRAAPASDRYYIIVDHPDDTPSGLQIQERADDMINGAKPRPTKQLASLEAIMAPVTANATSARL